MSFGKLFQSLNEFGKFEEYKSYPDHLQPCREDRGWVGYIHFGETGGWRLLTCTHSLPLCTSLFLSLFSLPSSFSLSLPLFLPPSPPPSFSLSLCYRFRSHSYWSQFRDCRSSCVLYRWASMCSCGCWPSHMDTLFIWECTNTRFSWKKSRSMKKVHLGLHCAFVTILHFFSFPRTSLFLHLCSFSLVFPHLLLLYVSSSICFHTPSCHFLGSSFSLSPPFLNRWKCLGT